MLLPYKPYWFGGVGNKKNFVKSRGWVEVFNAYLFGKDRLITIDR